jgi:NAD(P)H-hydrate epimerase
MTVGGTGDVLSGIAGAFLAQGITPLQSAVAAAFINGVAGGMVINEKGYHMEPGDLIGKIPYAIEDALQGRLRAS